MPSSPPLPAKPAPEAAEHPYRIGDLCAELETYLSAAEVADVYHAYLFGAEAHEGQ